MRFPLRFRPNLGYRDGLRRFGAPRAEGRLHAGCDLLAPHGAEVVAVDRGTVTRAAYLFFDETYAIEIRHTRFVVRYGEILEAARGLEPGAQVLEGQVIAYVGTTRAGSMLHLEMYSGTAQGLLTQRDNPPYERRADLMDPTEYLDQWPVL